MYNILCCELLYTKTETENFYLYYFRKKNHCIAIHNALYNYAIKYYVIGTINIYILQFYRRYRI